MQIRRSISGTFLFALVRFTLWPAGIFWIRLFIISSENIFSRFPTNCGRYTFLGMCHTLYPFLLALLTVVHMVIETFNHHRTILLFTEHVYIIYILTSLRYQLFSYHPPFISLNPPWHPRIRPHLQPMPPLYLRLPWERKIQINALLPWMSGPLYQTLGSIPNNRPCCFPQKHSNTWLYQHPGRPHWSVKKPLYTTSLKTFYF